MAVSLQENCSASRRVALRSGGLASKARTPSATAAGLRSRSRTPASGLSTISGEPPDCRRSDRRSTRHRFHQDVGDTLAVGAEQQCIRGADQLRQLPLIDMAQEAELAL